MNAKDKELEQLQAQVREMEVEKEALAERLVSVRVVEQKAVVQVENS